MANRAGMNYKIQPTPAVALGAYEITPLEAAGAYTMFANQGAYVKPSFLTLVRDHDGKTLYKNQMERKQALDPRVAYLDDQPDGGSAAQRHRRRASRERTTSPCRPPARPARRATAGSRATPANCCAWCGWGSTTTAIWIWKARIRPRPSGREFMKRALAVSRVSRRQAVPGSRRHRRASMIDPGIRHARHAPTAPKRRPEVYIAGHRAGGKLPAARAAARR